MDLMREPQRHFLVVFNFQCLFEVVACQLSDREQEEHSSLCFFLTFKGDGITKNKGPRIY